MHTLPGRRSFDIAFAIIVLIELGSHLLLQSNPTIHAISKPALLISLSIYFWLATAGQRSTDTHLFQAALFFSWLGDVLLLFQVRDPLFFMLGLGAFLTAHVLYIAVFVRVPQLPGRPSLLSRRPWLAGLVFVYSIGLVWLLLPHLGALLVPVVAYAAIISLMLLTALNLQGRMPTVCYQYLLAGALCFVVSDSLLAINKFMTPLPQASFLIMLTYIAAQYQLVMGYLRYTQQGATA